MKRVVYLLFGSFIILAILVTLVSLLFPSHVRISRAIDLSISKQDAQQRMNDSLILKEMFAGQFKPLKIATTDSTFHAVGAEQAAIQMNTGWQLIASQSNTCTLQWYMDFYFDWYPWEKFASLLVEARYGSFMEQQLKLLKSIVEKAN